METKIERKIEDLEQKIVTPQPPTKPSDSVIPSMFSNRIEVTDGSITAIYIGMFSHLNYFNNRDESNRHKRRISIWGKAKLVRLEICPKTETIQKLTSIVPPRIEKEYKNSLGEKQLWEAKLGGYPDLNINGSTRLNYRKQLQEKIAKKYYVKVSDELMSQVFNPLDQKLVDWYKSENARMGWNL